MPSTRKRIGYLPSPNVQDLITKISNNKKISQSKLVDILVEEALIARGLIALQKPNDLNVKQWYKNKRDINKSSKKYNELDELISDKGITYNKKESKVYKSFSENNSNEANEDFNRDLFEQFRQFLLFQKMLKEETL